jgi:NAD(P)-dependent dehydrogenase (short-subunit alcohol dehydrogenase family)
MTTAFLPLLQKATEHQYAYSATVINISSISGLVKSSQHHFSYNSSKAAAIQLNKLLAAEIAGNGLKIHVNSIAPGVFPSEMTAGGSGEDQKSHIEKEKYEKVPARRPGNDRNMASALYLRCAISTSTDRQWQLMADIFFTLEPDLFRWKDEQSSMLGILPNVPCM